METANFHGSFSELTELNEVDQILERHGQTSMDRTLLFFFTPASIVQSYVFGPAFSRPTFSIFSALQFWSVIFQSCGRL